MGPNVSPNDWACFMAVDTALQPLASSVTAIAYGLAYSASHYLEYNRLSFKSMGRNADYTKLMLQLVLMVCAEMVNYSLMELWYRRKLGNLGAIKRLLLIFRNSEFFAYVSAMCFLQNINPWNRLIIDLFCT